MRGFFVRIFQLVCSKLQSQPKQLPPELLVFYSWAVMSFYLVYIFVRVLDFRGFANW